MMQSCRQDWLSRLLKIEGNVLDHLAEGRLKATMPLSVHSDRADFAPLEAFGRSMLGLAPWLGRTPTPLMRTSALCRPSGGRRPSAASTRPPTPPPRTS